MFISDDGSVVVDDDVDVVGVLAALWILNPKINEEVPIKKETTARIFPVIPGMRGSGEPWLVCCCCCCCCALTVILLLSKHRNDRDNSIILDVKKNNNNAIKRFGKNLVIVFTLSSPEYMKNQLNLGNVDVLMLKGCRDRPLSK